MNITKEQAKQHLENLSNNWYDDECEDYEIENDCEDADSIPTHKLKSHNYKDLRILEDYLNQDNNIDKAIEEAKNLFTDEQENEVMNQDEPDVSFDVGFYRGLLEAKNYLNQDDYHEKAKDILWEYISDKDLPVIEQRLSDIEQIFDENDFTLVKSITQGENLFEHKNGCLYIVEYEEVDNEEIHDFDNPTLYMNKDGNKVF